MFFRTKDIASSHMRRSARFLSRFFPFSPSPLPPSLPNPPFREGITEYITPSSSSSTNWTFHGSSSRIHTTGGSTSPPSLASSSSSSSSSSSRPRPSALFVTGLPPTVTVAALVAHFAALDVPVELHHVALSRAASGAWHAVVSFPTPGDAASALTTIGPGTRDILGSPCFVKLDQGPRARPPVPGPIYPSQPGILPFLRDLPEQRWYDAQSGLVQHLHRATRTRNAKQLAEALRRVATAARKHQRRQRPGPGPRPRIPMMMTDAAGTVLSSSHDDDDHHHHHHHRHELPSPALLVEGLRALIETLHATGLEDTDADRNRIVESFHVDIKEETGVTSTSTCTSAAAAAALVAGLHATRDLRVPLEDPVFDDLFTRLLRTSGVAFDDLGVMLELWVKRGYDASEDDLFQLIERLTTTLPRPGPGSRQPAVVDDKDHSNDRTMTTTTTTTTTTSSIRRRRADVVDQAAELDDATQVSIVDPVACTRVLTSLMALGFYSDATRDLVPRLFAHLEEALRAQPRDAPPAWLGHIYTALIAWNASASDRAAIPGHGFTMRYNHEHNRDHDQDLELADAWRVPRSLTEALAIATRLQLTAPLPAPLSTVRASLLLRGVTRVVPGGLDPGPEAMETLLGALLREDRDASTRSPRTVVGDSWLRPGTLCAVLKAAGCAFRPHPITKRALRPYVAASVVIEEGQGSVGAFRANPGENGNPNPNPNPINPKPDVRVHYVLPPTVVASLVEDCLTNYWSRVTTSQLETIVTYVHRHGVVLSPAAKRQLVRRAAYWALTSSGSPDPEIDVEVDDQEDDDGLPRVVRRQIRRWRQRMGWLDEQEVFDREVDRRRETMIMMGGDGDQDRGVARGSSAARVVGAEWVSSVAASAWSASDRIRRVLEGGEAEERAEAHKRARFSSSSSSSSSSSYDDDDDEKFVRVALVMDFPFTGPYGDAYHGTDTTHADMGAEKALTKVSPFLVTIPYSSLALALTGASRTSTTR